MKKLIIVAIALFSLDFSFAQNVEWEKDNFPDKKKEFKEAYDNFKQGQSLYYEGRFQLKNALKYLKKANKFNPNNAITNYYIGKCILGTIRKAESVGYFEKAFELDPKVADDIYYQLAQSHHINEDWDIAIDNYFKYEEHLKGKYKKPDDDELLLKLKICDKHIEECKYAKQFIKEPKRVFIDNIGAPINTEYAEYGPVITADNTTMFITTRKPGVTGSYFESEKDMRNDKQEQHFYEDIYVTYKSKNGKWSNPKNLGKPINTNGHEATVAISPDGQDILFYSAASEDGGLYESALDGDEWGKPKKLHKNINSKYHESSGAYSLDRKRIYFVSSNPVNNLGGVDFLNEAPDLTHDIFYSDWDDQKDRWGEPKNIGPTLNTEYNERGVFLHPNGKTLFFSSEGHNSMGGYDIFKSEYDEENNTWSEPENLGYPINGPDDDIFFVLTADGKTGYYASEQSDGFGMQDIYVITFLGPEKLPITTVEEQLLIGSKSPFTEEIVTDPITVITAQSTILKGRTLDEKTQKPVEASIELTDNTKQKVIATFQSNSKTGKFLVSLPAGKNYGIAVTSDDYLFHSENFEIPDTAAFQEINKDVFLKKVETGKAIVLKNIFFDFDKATLRDESIPELSRLIKLLNENGSISIEIGGHTDNKGSDTYNQNLSERRAKTVVDYLIDKGIEQKRLSFKGYGEAVPIADNDSEKGRQENRRTEFKILKN